MEHNQKAAQRQRREFMKFLGAAGVSLPLLKASALGSGALLTRQAQASGNPTRRVIFVYIPDGTPRGASFSYTPSADLTLKICSAPLEPVKQECVFFDDMNIVGGGGHGLTQRVLGAFADGVQGSIDLALESVVGATSPVASLRLGVRTRGEDPISARGFSAVTDFQDNPRSAFDRLFGGTIDTSPIGERREKRILEVNRLALEQLQQRLGHYERQRIEQHMASIEKLHSDIEHAASGSAPAGCTEPNYNPQGLNDISNDSAFTDLFALQTENIILALSCNITRVATMQLGTHQADFSVTTRDGEYHDAIHSGDRPRYEHFRSYFSERMTHLIQRLAETTDPTSGGSLLDNTLVVQVTDMGDGDAHYGHDAPFMLAGGGNAIRRGQVVNVDNHHQLLDTVAEYMGAYGVIAPYSSSPATGILT
ncbi:DUF1552 domain-containing protein [Marinimicrobium alkaliphilum]|uniref:DUF1552 domain-containing protein n=1 Tax=Marinimicrobium alkaliphilum TaxID=2202654 RepID=UPI000DBAD18D|nr:DUF1552 domain-containing protein [Marinimicrobium alkaliphilum]